MKVPFLDLRATYSELRSEIDEAVSRVLSGGWYIGGDAVGRFEEDFSAYVGSAYCVGVGNGLDALVLGLRALGVGPGDEVIVPSNTYIATWLAVSAVGGTIVPVEPDVDSFNLRAAEVAEAITSKTKVILPVHLYGLPAEIDGIVDLAKQHGVRVLEDGAQAHGAKMGGRRIGSHGDAVAWSFYPGKNLGAFGDGGALTTGSEEIADRVRVLGNYGSRKKYFNEVKGVNSRLDPLQAAVLSAKLQVLDEWNDRRARIAERYREGLRDTSVHLPATFSDRTSVWHLFVVLCADRDRLQACLADRGVGTVVHYPVPPFKQSAYSEEFGGTDYPIASRIADGCLSLPMGPHLSDAEVDYVIESVRCSLAEIG